MRKPIIAGNWKMNKTAAEARTLIQMLKNKIDTDKVEVVVCPTFTSIGAVIEEIEGTKIGVGAQNMHFENSGAFTGEISADMLVEAGVKYVIIGHSERRQYFNETDETVNKKLVKAIEKKLVPIVCVGESLEQREAGQEKTIVTNQVKAAFKDVSGSDAPKVVVAYEPIWAIGTGKTASSEQAEEVCGWIRNTIEEMYDNKVSQAVRIQYGGSVNANNVNELMGMENIDGALVGGASLKEDFASLVNYEA
ncbi:triose-phosphate isomerase [Alkalibacter mobilis]|uniref:triose-phosphate isomerase n=1 Tax=Alkalibacter mobilis TaxID=2787712 RepID=UPI00189CA4A7|nr:triose-phosphate isomerase [Alkalibacter mobilis]MBF7097229.1 triose-phosphate isomerase [Alkalibacter mobilis]